MLDKTCNACKHLIIDEDEQNVAKAYHGIYLPHICIKYDKRVTHYPYRHPKIHPCKECEREGDI